MTRTAAEVLAGPASGVEVYDGIERPPNDEKLIERDGRGRPYIIDPDGKRVTYTRVTTFVGALDETTNLGKWLRRQVLKGVALKPDRIIAQVGQFAGGEFEKTELDRLAEEAIDYANANDKAAIGTAVHALTERHDMGLPITVLPGIYVNDLAEWARITRHWTNVHIEHFMVNDEIKTGGTPDRIVRWHPCEECGKSLFIVDLKGLALDTPLPTPTGWTTMGEVRTGDQVLGRDGLPCTVTAKSATKRIGTYVVTFDDGAQVTCDSEHLWETTTGQPSVARTTVKDIETIRATLWNKYGQRDHRVAMPEPLILPEAKVPIAPYVLGVWIGDGAARGGTITKERDLFEVLVADGVPLGIEQVDGRTGVITRTVLGLTTELREAGLLHDKHIPERYLRGSFEQRLLLLQGLMDTDGTWNKARRTAVFNTTQEALARQVEELLLTLGQCPRVWSAMTTGFGLTVRSWAVEFTPIVVNPFRLPRKASQAASSTKNLTSARRRIVVSVEPGPDIETACIAVDSVDQMYLCGRRMVPTHNTGRIDTFTHLKVCMQLAVYANSQLYVRATGARIPLEDLCQCQGYVVHLVAGSGQAELFRYDLATGWDYAVRLAAEVRKARSSVRDLAREFDPLLIEIWKAGSRQRLEDLWYGAYAGEWSERHTKAAGARAWQLDNVRELNPPREVVDNLTTSG